MHFWNNYLLFSMLLCDSFLFSSGAYQKYEWYHHNMTPNHWNQILKCSKMYAARFISLDSFHRYRSLENIMFSPKFLRIMHKYDETRSFQCFIVRGQCMRFIHKYTAHFIFCFSFIKCQMLIRMLIYMCKKWCA